MGVGVTVRGAPEAVAALERLRVGAVRFGGAAYAVGSPLVYAYGIETGRHRSGRLARRAGGARMLGGAIDALVAGGAAVLADAAAQAIGAGVVLDGRALVHLVALRVQRGAMQRSPVRTGTLRRSFHTQALS